MQQQNRIKAKSYSILFLSIVLLHIFVDIFLSIINTGFEIPIILQFIISEMTIIVPSLLWLLCLNVPIKETLGFKKIKVSTVLMTILLAEILSPLVSLVNLLSQFFTKNAVMDIAGEVLDENFFVMAFIIGIFGPFCEEFVFRGIIARGLGRFASVIGASIVSGLFFGLLHMNLNQMCYAFLLGVIFSIINYASGSIYTSVVMHIVYNLQNVIMLFALKKFYLNIGLDAIAEANESLTGDMMYYMVGVYLILAVIFTLVSLPVFAFIARNEGNADAYLKLTLKPETEDIDNKANKKSWFLNPYSVIACFVCVFVIFALDIVLKFFGM